MRKRLLAFIAVVGLVIGGGMLGMQPASATCDGRRFGTSPLTPAGNGDELIGVYVDASATSEVLGDDAVPELGTPNGAYVEVQDDGQYAPVNIEAGVYHGKKLTFTCSDVIIESAEDQLP